MNNKTRQVLLHVCGCMVFLMLPVLFAPDLPESFNITRSIPTQRNMLAYLLMIAFFYLNYFVLIPRFYFTGKYARFVIAILLCFMVVVTLPHFIIPNGSHRSQPPPRRELSDRPPPRPMPMPGNEGFNRQPGPGEPERFSVFNITQHLFIFLAVVFFSLILRISNRWKQSEREKLNAELQYLKSQVNPHFLFNTLNNIYSLALQKSDNTASAVVKLSGMMRYVLSEADKDYVPLEKELAYINSYIELQKIRFEDTVKLEFETGGDQHGKKIAPLILISFIENAFKHGVNAEEDSDISIRIHITETELDMLVTNNKVTHADDTAQHSGLGIENTKNRLQLLYPFKHTLVIDDSSDNFTVALKLIIA
ncbi:sensor histidine kinase [Foetidibacter luteolus]|uniref:sensor histidine kinase n=1 Tax=Foetidibacter luteolus TaxID=2608880 RepID=UPI00129BF9FE|nr:histidine kinase [Foetidibacter luteolus]